MASQILLLLTVLAIMASSLWTTAYLTMMVSYTMLEAFAFAYAGTIMLGLFIASRIRKV